MGRPVVVPGSGLLDLDVQQTGFVVRGRAERINLACRGSMGP
jgi:hypothetical protein